MIIFKNCLIYHGGDSNIAINLTQKLKTHKIGFKLKSQDFNNRIGSIGFDHTPMVEIHANPP